MAAHQTFKHLGRLVEVTLGIFALLAAPTFGEMSSLPLILDSTSWESARELLPDEILNRYRTGAWNHEIREAPADTRFFDDDLISAGKRNDGHYTIGSDGQIIDLRTGKLPSYIYGPPFPTIDPADVHAGTKIVWNYFYQSYSLGNTDSAVAVDWVGTGGLERRVSTQVYLRFFDGQAPKHQPAENPQNFLFQQRTSVAKPADLQGTLSLTHRFRDPTKRDQVWTYVPALRRVRAVSPINRSDGFLGSDMSQDDGPFFDGKPEDFEWKLVGQGDVLMLYDRASVLSGERRLSQSPEGGSISVDSLRPRFNYQLPSWTGQAWAPLSSEFILVRRPVWIVEGVPKDRYYLYGKIVLRFDRESWRGTYNSKFDWKGEIINTYIPAYGPYFDNDGEWYSYASCFFTLAQSWRLNRATATRADEAHPQTRVRIPLQSNLFSVDTLAHGGK